MFWTKKEITTMRDMGLEDDDLKNMDLERTLRTESKNKESKMVKDLPGQYVRHLISTIFFKQLFTQPWLAQSI